MPHTEILDFPTTPELIDKAFAAALTASAGLQVARTNLARIRGEEAIYPDEAIKATFILWQHLKQLGDSNNFDVLLNISTRLDTLLNFILVSPEIDRQELLPFLQKLSSWVNSNTAKVQNPNFKSMLENKLLEISAQAA